jgi:hypothetical protein
MPASKGKIVKLSILTSIDSGQSVCYTLTICFLQNQKKVSMVFVNIGQVSNNQPTLCHSSKN